MFQQTITWDKKTVAGECDKENTAGNNHMMLNTHIPDYSHKGSEVRKRESMLLN